jgi:hypothetical protein
MQRGNCVRFYAIITVSILLGMPQPVSAWRVVWDPGLLGTFQAVSYGSQCGVSTDFIDGSLVTGWGLQGGTSDLLLDSGEETQLRFAFPVRALTYQVVSATNGDGDAGGETFVEAFDASDASLGVELVSGIGTKDVSSLFGDVPIERIVLTAGPSDGVRLRRISYDLPAGESITIYPGQGFFAASSSYVTAELNQCGAVFRGSPGSVRSQGGVEGISVTGGNAESLIDAGEELEVELEEPVLGVRYRLTGANDVNTNGEDGDHFVEAFDEFGDSLGLRSADADGTIDLSAPAYYGSQWISRFVLIAVADQFRLSNVTIVPEPDAALAALVSMALLALLRRR